MNPEGQPECALSRRCGPLQGSTQLKGADSLLLTIQLIFLFS